MIGKVTGRTLSRWAVIPLFVTLAAPAMAQVNSKTVIPAQPLLNIGQLLNGSQHAIASTDQPLRLAGATQRANARAVWAAHQAAKMARQKAAAELRAAARAKFAASQAAKAATRAKAREAFAASHAAHMARFK